jgi:DNA-binding MarR family transcriptional regulator
MTMDVCTSFVSKMPSRKSLPQLPCSCATLRRADRAVIALYDGELRRTGFRTTQFTLLQAIDRSGETTQGRVGEMLALDSTTLTRTLAPLIHRGLIAARPGRDRRQRLLRLTPRGGRKMRRLTQHWERAQRRLRRALGTSEWRTLHALLDRLAVFGKVESDIATTRGDGP